MKRIISLLLICLMVVTLCSCGAQNPANNAESTTAAEETTIQLPVENEKYKIDKEVVEDVKEQVEEGENVGTVDVQKSTPKEETKVEEELELDGKIDQENISYDGTYTGKGTSLLGKYQGLTYYSQMDSRWGSIMYSAKGDRSQTIKSSGCGPTSAAIIISSSKGAITPPTTADIALRYGYRTRDNGTAWSYWSFIADYFDFDYYAQTYNYSTMISKLKTDKNKDGVSDYFVVASCGYGLFTTGGHYIALMGFNGKIVVYDPYYYSGKFDTASRRAAGVVTKGNIAYVTEWAFKNYGNAQSYWIYSNDSAKAKKATPSKTNTTGKTTTATYYVKTKGSNLNIRSGPSTGYSIVGSLKNGSKVTVYENRGNWSKIGSGKWVCNDYLAKSTTTNTAAKYKTTIGGLYRLKAYTTLYSKGNLTGTQYQYYAKTQIKVLKHYSASVDYIYVVKTGRYAYCQVSKFA